MSTHLEATHAQLIRLRNSEDQTLSQASKAVLADIYFALDGRYDPLACIRRARQSWEIVGQTTETQTWMRRVAESLALAESELALLGFQPRLARPRFSVRAGEFILRDIERPVLLGLKAEGSTTSPFSVASTTEVPDGFRQDAFPAFTAEGWKSIRLDQLYQDVAALSTQLRPQFGDMWRSLNFIEIRLFAQIDAAHTLAQQLEELEGIFLQSPAPDPAQLAAVSLLLGSLAGRDGLAVSERCFEKVWDESPEFAEHLADAWAILPQPRIEDVTSQWLRDERVLFRRTAVVIRARRATLTREEAIASCRDHDDVAAEALVPFVLLSAGQERALLDEMALRYEAASPDFQFSFLLAGILSNYPSARIYAAHRCHEGQPDFSSLAGISAELADAQRLLEWTAMNPNPALVDALGWAGDQTCLGLLVGLLSLTDEEIVVNAAAALERITGAGLVDDYPVAAEATINEELFEKEAPADVLEGREAQPEPEAEMIELPSRSPDRWRAYVEANTAILVPGVRTRRGYLYSPLVSLFELDSIPTTAKNRRMLAYEIMIRSGYFFHFDERALVSHQEQKILGLRNLLTSKHWDAGAWSLPLQRQRISI